MEGRAGGQRLQPQRFRLHRYQPQHSQNAQRHVDAARNRFLPTIRAALSAAPIRGRITMSGYEGSELLVARLLVVVFLGLIVRKLVLANVLLCGSLAHIGKIREATNVSKENAHITARATKG